MLCFQIEKANEWQKSLRGTIYIFNNILFHLTTDSECGKIYGIDSGSEISNEHGDQVTTRSSLILTHVIAICKMTGSLIY